MVVGILKLELWIPQSTSLKGKRSVVKKVLERTRARFNVTVAEVDQQDLHSRSVIGFAMVGSDQRYVNGAVDKILDFIEGLAVAEILSEADSAPPRSERGGQPPPEYGKHRKPCNEVRHERDLFRQTTDLDEVIQEIERVNAAMRILRAISEELFRPEYLGLTVLGDIDRDALASINRTVDQDAGTVKTHSRASLEFFAASKLTHPPTEHERTAHDPSVQPTGNGANLEPENKYGIWLRIEKLACEAYAEPR